MSEITNNDVIALMEQFAAAGKPVLGYAIEEKQMPEPTIEGWNALTDCPRCGALAYISANTEGEGILIARTDAEIIRAFIERVEKLKRQSGEPRFGYRQRVYAELATMESEVRE